MGRGAGSCHRFDISGLFTASAEDVSRRADGRQGVRRKQTLRKKLLPTCYIARAALPAPFRSAEGDLTAATRADPA